MEKGSECKRQEAGTDWKTVLAVQARWWSPGRGCSSEEGRSSQTQDVLCKYYRTC